MKLFVLAFLTGIGFKFGEFLIDFLFSLIPRKRRKNKVSYRHYYYQQKDWAANNGSFFLSQIRIQYAGDGKTC